MRDFCQEKQVCERDLRYVNEIQRRSGASVSASDLSLTVRASSEGSAPWRARAISRPAIGRKIAHTDAFLAAAAPTETRQQRHDTSLASSVFGSCLSPLRFHLAGLESCLDRGAKLPTDIRCFRHNCLTALIQYTLPARPSFLFCLHSSPSSRTRQLHLLPTLAQNGFRAV